MTTPVVQTSLAPPPLKQPLLDEDGNITRAWQIWFTQVDKVTDNGITGTFLDHGGNTIHVQNGKIIGLS